MRSIIDMGKTNNYAWGRYRAIEESEKEYFAEVAKFIEENPEFKPGTALNAKWDLAVRYLSTNYRNDQYPTSWFLEEGARMAKATYIH